MMLIKGAELDYQVIALSEESPFLIGFSLDSEMPNLPDPVPFC